MTLMTPYQPGLNGIALEMAGQTDTGCKRDKNEDFFLINPEHGLCIVADGMGGHRAGEIASGIAASNTAEQIIRALDYQNRQHITATTALPLRRLIKAAIEDANMAIIRQARKSAKQTGMGTTIVTLLFRGNWFVIGNVGDSRGYRLRDGELKQLSVDHSLIQDMVKRGIISSEDAQHSPKRGLLLQALGNHDVDPSFTSGCPLAGDCFLLCTDGLTEVVDDREIRDILVEHDDPAESCRILVDTARRHGGPDNITVAVVRVRDASARR